jgi:peroxiredoxin
MMPSIEPGAAFPPMSLTLLTGEDVTFSDGHWHLLVIYRGAHCPMCRAYLTAAEAHRARFAEAGFRLVLASADSADRTRALLAETGYNGPVVVGLSVDQMQGLGLCMTLAGDTGAAGRFAEPAAFAVDAEGRLHLVQIGNAPYARPDLEALLAGLTYDRDNAIQPRGGAR